MSRMLIQQSDGKRRPYETGARSRVTIGRSFESDVVLTDPALSRSHAELAVTGDGWRLRDCGSRNGTFVNGRRITGPTDLSPGDAIDVGRTTITFEPIGDTSHSMPLSEGAVSSSETRFLTSEEARRLGPPAGWFEILEQAGRELTPGCLSMEDLHRKAVDLVWRAIKPQRAALFLKSADGEFTCQAYRGPIGDRQAPAFRSITRRVVDDGVTVVMRDAQVEGDGASSLAGVRSLIAAPLRDDSGVTGFIYVDTAAEGLVFSDKQLRLVTLLADLVSIQIQGAIACQERAIQRQYEAEAKSAAEVQERLLPQAIPSIPGYEFEWHHVCSFRVGGDYCDCLPLDEGRFGAVLSDVAGHGMGAAMLMAVTQATLRTHAAAGIELNRLVAQLHDAIWRAAPDNRFVTFFFAELDPKFHGIRYVNAGHAPRPLIVRSNGSVEYLAAGSPPVALLPEIRCEPKHTELGPGDFLFSCTDGLTDTQAPDESTFGTDRLERLLCRLVGQPADEIRHIVEVEVNDFAQGTPQQDDLTFSILRRRE